MATSRSALERATSNAEKLGRTQALERIVRGENRGRNALVMAAGQQDRASSERQARTERETANRAQAGEQFQATMGERQAGREATGDLAREQMAQRGTEHAAELGERQATREQLAGAQRRQDVLGVAKTVTGPSRLRLINQGIGQAQGTQQGEQPAGQPLLGPDTQFLPDPAMIQGQLGSLQQQQSEASSAGLHNLAMHFGRQMQAVQQGQDATAITMDPATQEELVRMEQRGDPAQMAQEAQMATFTQAPIGGTPADATGTISTIVKDAEKSVFDIDSEQLGAKLGGDPGLQSTATQMVERAVSEGVEPGAAVSQVEKSLEKLIYDLVGKKMGWEDRDLEAGELGGLTAQSYRYEQDTMSAAMNLLRPIIRQAAQQSAGRAAAISGQKERVAGRSSRLSAAVERSRVPSPPGASAPE